MQKQRTDIRKQGRLLEETTGHVETLALS
ncbi:MAG: hypothetical protein JWN25_3379, partial [Verrucomicrobiales bacterium]|nr:hypothetical protein [Verrucomicrobiales bacterium]